MTNGCLAMGVYIATEYCRGGINERRIPVWLPLLRRTMTAHDDLDFYQLWKRNDLCSTLFS